MSRPPLRRSRLAGLVGAGALTVVAVSALAIAVRDGPYEETESGPPPRAPVRDASASCYGTLEGSAFTFGCDEAIGGNAQRWLFIFSSEEVETATVTSPGAVRCEGGSSRTLCRGAAIPAGHPVSGYFSIGQAEEEEWEEWEEEEWEEGEYERAGCIAVAVTVFGSGSDAGEEGEAPTPTAIGRFLLSSCRPEEGGKSGGGASLAFGKVKLRKRNGTAILPVTVSAAGSLTLGGKGVVRATRRLTRAGTALLAVRARDRANARLHHSGKATLKVKVTFVPSGAAPVAKTKRITLRHD